MSIWIFLKLIGSLALLMYGMKVMSESLQKMADRLDAMSRSLAQDNIDAFTSNLRFIEGRYGEEFNPA